MPDLKKDFIRQLIDTTSPNSLVPMLARSTLTRPRILTLHKMTFRKKLSVSFALAARVLDKAASVHQTRICRCHLCFDNYRQCTVLSWCTKTLQQLIEPFLRNSSVVDLPPLFAKLRRAHNSTISRSTQTKK